MHRSAALPLLAALSSSAFAGTFATSVQSYDQGTGPVAGFTDPATALGSPTRTSGFDLRVTPFNPAFQNTEIVSIGRGGQLTLAFDSPVTDDASNPYGIDLIVFGNSFFYADDFSPLADHLWKPGGIIEVSADGHDWRTIPALDADGLFPTLGFQDSTDPFGSDGGASPTNFRVPVNPSFSPWGKDFAQLKAGYGTSGGGTGIDLAVVGLTQASFVRISNPSGAPYAIEIDAVSDVVPAPASLSIMFVAAAGLRRRR